MSDGRVAVVYFSQTHNTERVARAIVEGMVRAGLEAQLFDMLKTDPRSLMAYEMIGIGTPVFYYREPVVVERFVREMPTMPGKHAFVFLTAGGQSGNTFFHLSRTLRRRGLVVIDSFACHGYDTYPPFLGAGRFEGHPDREDLALAREFGAGLSERSRRVSEGRRELLPRWKRNWDRFGRLSMVFRSGLLSRLILPRKVVNVEKCIRCGICADRCPVKVIRMDPYPRFVPGCVYCYLCQRVCPVDAIECDWTGIKRKLESYDATEKNKNAGGSP